MTTQPPIRGLAVSMLRRIAEKDPAISTDDVEQLAHEYLRWARADLAQALLHDPVVFSKVVDLCSLILDRAP